MKRRLRKLLTLVMALVLTFSLGVSTAISLAYSVEFKGDNSVKFEGLGDDLKLEGSSGTFQVEPDPDWDLSSLEVELKAGTLKVKHDVDQGDWVHFFKEEEKKGKISRLDFDVKYVFDGTYIVFTIEGNGEEEPPEEDEGEEGEKTVIVYHALSHFQFWAEFVETTEESTEESSEDITEGSSEDITEGSSEDNTEGSSEDNTEGSSEDNTEGSSEDNTEGSSEDNTEGSSEDNTEGSSEDNTEGSSEDNTEFSTENNTEETNEESTETTTRRRRTTTEATTETTTIIIETTVPEGPPEEFTDPIIPEVPPVVEQTQAVEEVLEIIVPLGAPLPQTGGIPAEAVYLFGAAVAGAGILLKKKR